MKALAVACATLATAVLIAACGGSGGLIPAATSSQLRLDLTKIQTDVDGHDCRATTTDIATANNDFNNIPTSVSASLTGQLQTGLTALTTAALTECQGSTSSTGPTQTGPTGPTNATSATSSTSSTSSTTSSTASSTASTTSTTESSTPTTTTDTNTTTGDGGSTCTSTTGEGGGTQACDGGTTPPTGGIGGPGQ
jgi:hypothetical protein